MQTRIGFGLLALALGLVSVPLAAAQQDPVAPRYNVVGLQAEAEREVPNDLLHATVYVELNDPDPAALSDALNRRVAEAMRIAGAAKGVQARTGNNRSHPVYAQGNVLEGWRGRAEIRLESRDFDAASRLIGRLQGGMQLAGVSFSVSPATRRAVENELIAEAIAAFKARAEIAKSSLGGRAYRIIRLNVGSGQRIGVPRPAMARSALAAPAVAPPVLEGGVSHVRVTAEGEVEILE